MSMNTILLVSNGAPSKDIKRIHPNKPEIVILSLANGESWTSQ